MAASTDFMPFLAFLDGKLVSVSALAATFGVAEYELRAALAWDDYSPDADGMILAGVARKAAARIPPRPVQDDSHDRMGRMRFER